MDKEYAKDFMSNKRKTPPKNRKIHYIYKEEKDDNITYKKGVLFFTRFERIYNEKKEFVDIRYFYKKKHLLNLDDSFFEDVNEKKQITRILEEEIDFSTGMFFTNERSCFIKLNSITKGKDVFEIIVSK